MSWGHFCVALSARTECFIGAGGRVMRALPWLPTLIDLLSAPSVLGQAAALWSVPACYVELWMLPRSIGSRTSSSLDRTRRLRWDGDVGVGRCHGYRPSTVTLRSIGSRTSSSLYLIYRLRWDGDFGIRRCHIYRISKITPKITDEI